MPAINPRLTITLDPAVAVSLRRLSEVTGNSQSKLISDLLEGSVPVFERVIATIEAANAASAEMRGRLASDMDKAQSRVEKHLGLVLDEFDQAAAPLTAPVDGVKRRARKKSAGRVDVGGTTPVRTPEARSVDVSPTPISNRGVRSNAKAPRKGL